MNELTKRQKDVLQCIKEFIVKKGYPPTVREIGEKLGVSSPATTFIHLKELEQKGYIKKNGCKNRAIELLVENEFKSKNDDIVKVPLLGKITAGNPIEAIENPNEFFSIPAYLIPNNKEVFTLNVKGESMINKGIYNNDIIIVERCNIAKNGDVVVAMNDDNEVTVKSYYKENGFFRLQPENDTMEPIILKNVTILGKAIGLYRKI